MLSGKINTMRIDIAECINLNSEIFYFYLLKFSCKIIEQCFPKSGPRDFLFWSARKNKTLTPYKNVQICTKIPYF